VLKKNTQPKLSPILEPKKKKLPIIRAYYQPFVFLAVPLSIISVVLTYIFYPFLPPVVPLFQTMVERSARLADKQMIYILPVMAVVINLVHATVIYFGRKYEVTLLQIFDFFTVFVQALLLAVLLRTILVVI
jgi:hypothetical protein